MRRREFITLLGDAAAWVSPASAQEPRRVIGFLGSASSDPFPERLASFAQGLKDTGFIEGNNINIEWRWAEGQYNRLPSVAGERGRTGQPRRGRDRTPAEPETRIGMRARAKGPRATLNLPTRFAESRTISSHAARLIASASATLMPSPPTPERAVVSGGGGAASDTGGTIVPPPGPRRQRSRVSACNASKATTGKAQKFAMREAMMRELGAQAARSA
jgi:hypothetical protein